MLYLPHFILTATSFPEVSDWRELSVDGLGVEPAVVQVHDGFLCILLSTKLHTQNTHDYLTRNLNLHNEMKNEYYRFK